jgi:hypothetical protein
MKQRQLNVFTHLIARYLKWGYSSRAGEPAPPRHQALLDRLSLKKGPADEVSPWTHYQKSD